MLLLASGCGRFGYEALPIDGGAVLDAGRDAAIMDARPFDAPVDAPSVDAPSVDAAVPPDAPSARELICRDAIACLDFEAPFAPPLVVDNETGSSAPTRDVLRPFRGSALHLHASSVVSTTSRIVYPVPSALFAAGAVYLSAWVRVEREEIPAYLALLEFNNALPGARFMKISVDQQLGEVLGLFTPSEYLRRAGFPSARWVCLELSVRPELAATNARASVDGVSLNKTDPLDPGVFQNATIALAAETGTHDVWFDDVYIGTRDVGCLPE